MPLIVNPEEMVRQGFSPFRSDLTVSMGDTLYNTQAKVAALLDAIDVGQEGLIFQHTVGPQEVIQVGYGIPELPDNQGYMQFAAVDSGVGHDQGTLRIVVDSHRGVAKSTLQLLSTSGLHGSSFVSAVTKHTQHLSLIHI